MGYRIRIAPEVKRWLAELRETEASAADLVDAALAALRDRGASMGPPLVVPVEPPSKEARPDLDYAYQRQLEMLTRVRRAVADVATARKRLELQIQQLEEVVRKLQAQRETGGDALASQARARQPVVAAQLADLRRQYASVRGEEERLNAASLRLQLKVDDFRIRKEAIKAADAAAEAAAEAEQAEAEIEAVAANAAGLDLPGVDAANLPGQPGRASSLPLSELRPGAPEMTDIRILFAVEPSGTAVILAAGTERDWLHAWYAEAILRARVRYERDRGEPG